MSDPFILSNEKFYSIPIFEKLSPGIVAGFTTKNGGISEKDYMTFNTGFHVGDRHDHVVTNRERLASSLSFSINKWVGAEQTHETRVLKVNSNDRGKGSSDYNSSFKQTDAFYTDERGILLTLCFADCVPIYFLAPKSRMIGIAHAGWKGSVHGIADRMVNTWKEEGINVSEIFAVIGPSICSDCYIVDERVINFAKNRLEEVDKKPYNLIKEGQYKLDLKELNALILEKAGVPKSNIYKTEHCTSCQNGHFFSHRKDSGKTGRMLGFIGWKEDTAIEGKR